MRTLILRFAAITVLAIGVLVLIVPAAEAQERCAPFGGTIYGWLLSDGWHGVGDFTVGRKLWHADVSVNTLSLVDGGDTWTGTEAIAFDFGKGNILQLSGTFVTEHMTDQGGSGGVFHINEGGPFVKGKGIFKNAYGYWTMQAPFGGGVALPDSIQHPPADWFWIGQYQGTICGIRDSD